ncbi:MAG: hypothetical protein JJ896_01045 [Rhodothermales bacterium]|nr:hypothetical protein [Rhodothermales bacterium]MBO6778214.1 hypothetical protein [Rhodothermales bacterium]
MIEAFLDGMLSPEERQTVLGRAARDAGFAARLDLAKSIREALRTMPSEAAPPDLLPAVIREVRRDARRQMLARVSRWFVSFDVRPALVTASLVLVIVMAGILGRPAEPVPTEPEVAEALEQIKWTLGLVSEVGQITAVHLRDDVLEPHVIGQLPGVVGEPFDAPRGARLN